MAELKYHYTKTELIDAIQRAGIGTGETVSLQVSLGRLGLPESASNYADASNLVIDAFLEALGPTGTLIVPTYSYSIGRGELFDVETTPSSIGEFTELFRARPGAIRSRDPMLSSAGIGPLAEEVLRRISNSCYGKGSTFHRLRDVGAKICTLGISLYWATFRHHIEEMADVPFRFKKRFIGSVREKGVTREEAWTYFAAPLVENCEPVGLPLEQKARAAGLVAIEPVGRGEIMCIGAREFFDFGLDALRKDPWLTAKGPACDVAELVRLEDARVGCKKLSVELPPSATIQQMISGLMVLPRDTVSEGFDAALAAIANQLPFRVHQYPTGTEIGSDIIPEKWTCREAFLATEDGQRIFSSMDDMNHVPAYCWPFKGSVSRTELLEHIYSSAAESSAVPFVTLLGHRQWGLCCSGRQSSELRHDRYEVEIHSAFSYGTCKVGETIIAGKSQRSIVLVARLDRRSDGWRGVSGAVVGIEAMKQLARADALDDTVRLLLIPGNIGLAAWVESNAEASSAISRVVVLDAVGTGSPLKLQGPSALAVAVNPNSDRAPVTVDSVSIEALIDACSSLVGLVASAASCTAR